LTFRKESAFMKKFLKMVFASTLGVLFASLIIVFGFGLVASGLYFIKSGQESTLKKHAPILRLALDNEIVDRPDRPSIGIEEEIPFLNGKQKFGLYNLIQMIDRASKDQDIQGLYLKLGSGLDGGWATISALYEALARFKKTGKFIIAYGENYNEKSYYLAQVAHKVFLYPAGAFEFNGLAMIQPYFKDFLDKINIHPQVFRAGKFKAAMEPFLFSKMSEENRLQDQELLSDLWSLYLERIHKNRHLPLKSLQEWVDRGLIQNAQDALSFGLVDHLTYEEAAWLNMKQRLKKIKGDDKNSDPDKEKDKDKDKDKAAHNNKTQQATTTLADQSLKTFNEEEVFTEASDYLHEIERRNKESSLNNSDNQIAMVYLSGEIVDGKISEGKVGSEGILETLREIRENKKVKAVVLRINSPGGSALASDVIWNELGLLRKKVPVIASFGDVAASGAYYLASNTDFIFARPDTITGSIGVFGVYINAEKIINEKMGIHFDGVKTGPYADLGAFYRPMTSDENLMVQKEVDKTYEMFLERVVTGRKLKSVDEVRPYAEGRIWSGRKAKSIGLVDEWGGPMEAIMQASQMAKLSQKYYVEIYPKRKGAFWELMSGLQEVEGETRAKLAMVLNLGPMSYIWDKLNLLRELEFLGEAHKGYRKIYMRMPFGFRIL
jgi:protease-4